jgi:diguanylate cyclase (GGDEF)-like protein
MPFLTDDETRNTTNNEFNEKPLAHILVVEDSPTQLQRLVHLLQENSYTVSAAKNGVEAIEMAQSRKLDLIISDILMPVMDGYEMCRRVKADGALQNVPVMLLTTLTAAEDVILGLNASADYYITKPYADEYLLSRVTTILKSSDACRDYNSDTDGMEVILADRSYTVRSGRRQMLNLLLSTYENAVQRNNELIKTQSELKLANRQLRDQHAQLQAANENLETANAQLADLASIDGLTGLKNHRSFQERLKEEHGRAVRYRTSLSLLMLDVDHFKSYNDTFGHPAGDEVLRAVSKIIQQEMRTTDFTARYGGEEFVVILPNTSGDGARGLAERLRSAIEQAPWTKRAITVSIGSASLTSHIDDSADIIAQADSALYQSKHKGRNCVTHIDENQPQLP